MGRRTLGLGSLLAGTCLATGTALAQDPSSPGAALSTPPVAESAEVERLPTQARLMVPVCAEVPFEQDTLVRQLDVALAAIGVRLVLHGLLDPVADGHAVISIEVDDCAASVSRAFIVLTHDPSGLRTRAEVDLSDTTRAERSRILAIAGAALLAEEWVALSVARRGNPYEDPTRAHEPPPVNPYGGEPSEPTVTPVPNPYRGRLVGVSREREMIREEARRALREMQGDERAVPSRFADVGLAFRLHPSRNAALFGFAATAFVRIQPSLRLAGTFTTLGGRGEKDGDQGRVRAVLTAIAVLLTSETRTHVIGIGPSVELGWAAAEPDNLGGRETGATATALVRTTVRGRLGPHAWLHIDAALGYVLLSLTANPGTGSTVGVHGPAIGIVTGVSFH